MTKGDSKNRVLSVRMWGVFGRRVKFPLVLMLKGTADCYVADRGGIVRPVTVSWEEKKRQS